MTTIKTFALIDTSDGCEIHKAGCSHIKRTEGRNALRAAVNYEAATVEEVIARWHDELRGDFGDDAENFYATVLPCAA